MKEPVMMRATEPHAGTLKDGRDFLISFGQLLPSDSEVVKRNPQFFAEAKFDAGSYVRAWDREGYDTP